jgi:hypothetical protein
MRESRSYGTVGGVVRLRAGRPYPGSNNVAAMCDEVRRSGTYPIR